MRCAMTMKNLCDNVAMNPKELLDSLIAKAKRDEQEDELHTHHPDLLALEREVFNAPDPELLARPYYLAPPIYPTGFYTEIGQMRANIEGNSLEELALLEKHNLLKYETIVKTEKEKYKKKNPVYLFNGSIERLKRLRGEETVSTKAIEEVFPDDLDREK